MRLGNNTRALGTSVDLTEVQEQVIQEFRLQAIRRELQRVSEASNDINLQPPSLATKQSSALACCTRGQHFRAFDLYRLRVQRNGPCASDVRTASRNERILATSLAICRRRNTLATVSLMLQVRLSSAFSSQAVRSVGEMGRDC